MTPDAAALIACESVLEPILERLTAVLEEHSGTFASPAGERTPAAAGNRRRRQPDDLGRHPRDARTDSTGAPLGPRCTLPPPLTAGSATAARTRQQDQ
jgi:hypothetical protein